jgi:hypothetical protein
MITKLRFLAEESYKNANPFWLRVRWYQKCSSLK